VTSWYDWRMAKQIRSRIVPIRGQVKFAPRRAAGVTPARNSKIGATRCSEPHTGNRHKGMRHNNDKEMTCQDIHSRQSTRCKSISSATAIT
jgi:hypothetical protein